MKLETFNANKRVLLFRKYLRNNYEPGNVNTLLMINKTDKDPQPRSLIFIANKISAKITET